MSKLVTIIFGVFLLFSIGLNVILLNDLRVEKKEPDDIKEKVGRHILVSSEEPTIAEIQDIEQLQDSNPAFYQNARNGDKVLAYSDKVVIYRESEDLIVSVTVVNRARTIQESNE